MHLAYTSHSQSVMFEGCLLTGLETLTKEGKRVTGQGEERVRRGGERAGGKEGRKKKQPMSRRGGQGVHRDHHALASKEHSRGEGGCVQMWSSLIFNS